MALARSRVARRLIVKRAMGFDVGDLDALRRGRRL